MENLKVFSLKIRGGSDMYIKRDGSQGTAGKGALVSEDLSFTVAATQDQTLIQPGGSGYVVRRLTPTECERLQGFPDGWTDIDGAKDTPRYKALGNSIAVPVLEWIGKRIEYVDGLL